MRPAWPHLAVTAVAIAMVTGCGFDDAEPTPTPTPDDVLMVVTEDPRAPAMATSPPRGSDSEYVIKSGDTLSSIAARYGVTLAELQRANGITDPDSIVVGQRITIP